MRITESKLRQIIRTEIIKTLSETSEMSHVGFIAQEQTPESEEIIKDIENEVEKEKDVIELELLALSPETLKKLQMQLNTLVALDEKSKLGGSLSQTQKMAMDIAGLTESEKNFETASAESLLKKVQDYLTSGGELNIPATATNALLIAPALSMKGELGVAGISVVAGLLLDLVNNAIQRKRKPSKKPA